MECLEQMVATSIFHLTNQLINFGNVFAILCINKKYDYEMSINFFKHTIPNMIKISLCERETVAWVKKFYISFIHNAI